MVWSLRDDLLALSSFGFRGEALSSLCAMSDVSVVTRTASEDAGTRIEYDHKGGIVSQESMARAVGTTVSLCNIFKPLPVRHKDFTRNVKREYGKLLTLLQAYALVSSGVRIVCSHQSGKTGSRSTVIHTQGNGSVRQNIATVFGAKTSSGLVPVEADLEGGCGCHLSGFVSKAEAGCGRGGGDRQFFYVNGRPVDWPKMSKLLNELYRAFCPNQFPVAVLDFRLPTDAYDVNVTPDKRKVLMHAEDALLHATRAALQTAYEPSRYTYAVGGGATRDDAMGGRAPRDGGLLGGVKGEPADVVEEQAPAPDALMLEAPESGGVGSGGDGEEGASEDVKPSQRMLLGDGDAGDAFGGFGLGAAPAGTSRRSTGGGGGGAGSFGGGAQRGLNRFGFTRKTTHVAGGGGWRFQAGDEDEREEVGNRGDAAEALPPATRTRTTRNAAARGEDDVSDDVVDDADDDADDEDYFVPDKGTRDEEAALKDERQRRLAMRKRPRGKEADDGAEDRRRAEADEDTTNVAKGSGSGAVVADEGRGEEDDQMAEDEEVEEFVVKEEPEEATDEPMGGGGVAQYAGTSIPFSLDTLRATRIAAKRRKLRAFRAGAGPDTTATTGGAFTAASLAGAADAPKDVSSSDGNGDDDDPSTGAIPQPSSATDTSDPLGSGVGEGDPKATSELERVFKKDDFKKMRIVGQFNLGFILATLGDDLFIVDQHASDEIFNFERLQRTTTLNRQPLIAPSRLDLTAAEEQTVRRHMNTFLANGFGFCEVAAGGGGGGCYGPSAFALSAVPFSKSTTFGAADVHELIGLLDAGEYALPARSQLTVGLASQAGDGLTKPQPGLVVSAVVRPTRVRSMLAMRACRSSIMIGKALNVRQMRRVLDNLSTLQAPWNCPHGRPTMRHLADLRRVLGRQGGGSEQRKGSGIGGW